MGSPLRDGTIWIHGRVGRGSFLAGESKRPEGDIMTDIEKLIEDLRRFMLKSQSVRNFGFLLDDEQCLLLFIELTRLRAFERGVTVTA